ncbi:hypothetical protein QQS21_006746 [Conoideocrella luteorostrata]|uniref:Uncharacterized protein n=1 Tax=Conoideocrella luteorostrata TaxID=1105319 RepID=A0AAJ0CPC4_9HYPO|nr:hypothetical protein QQS21_006746 [Conoideocrella luteorostrata]
MAGGVDEESFGSGSNNRHLSCLDDANNQSSSEAPPEPLLRQLDTPPISSHQLATEVNGIYAGLVLLEAKCIKYDDGSQHGVDLTMEQYRALVSLHRSLLHEHHDYLLASRHPSASDALARAASENAMPVRLWRHGIRSFLILLWHRLPESIEYILTFTNIAYTTVTMLYESVPAFEAIWVKILIEIARYRVHVAVKTSNADHKKTWIGIMHHWQAEASDMAPATSSVCHRPALIPQPNAVQQLYVYSKTHRALFVFDTTKNGLNVVFNPLLGPTPTSSQVLGAGRCDVDAILSPKKDVDQSERWMAQILDLLDRVVERGDGKRLESGQVSQYAIKPGSAMVD